MSKNVLYIIVGLVALVLVGVAVYYYTKSYTKMGSSSNTNTQEVSTNAVEIKDYAFNPSNIKVAKGTTVTWTNNDGATHHIKSDKFESQDLANGDKYSFTFNETGKFDYHCSIHTYMTGSVTVE